MNLRNSSAASTFSTPHRQSIDMVTAYSISLRPPRAGKNIDPRPLCGKGLEGGQKSLSNMYKDSALDCYQ